MGEVRPERIGIFEKINCTPDEIHKRAQTVPEKIKKRALMYIGKMEKSPSSGDPLEKASDLLNIRHDFYDIREHGENETVSNGAFKDWTSREIEELYKVLYGVEMD